MYVNITRLGEVQQEVEIELAPEELQPHFDRAYERYRPKVSVKGFRKGKVPMDLVRKLYGEAIEQDSLDELAGLFYRQVMQERKIHPIGTPSITEMDFKRGELFRFRIQYEVRPEFTLQEIKGIPVERPTHDVRDEEVEREIEHILRSGSTYEAGDSVEPERCVVTADIQEIDAAGNPLIGRRSEGVRLSMDDPALSPDIKSSLRGAVAGQEVRVSFESRHGDHTHTVHAAIMVRTIERMIVPALDEAFVQSATRGRIATVEEFRADLQKDLARFWREQSDRAVEQALVAEIVRRHDFQVPETLVNGILDSYIEEVRSNARDKVLPEDFDEQRFREEHRASAVFQGKWMLIRERIIAAEQLDVSDSDMENLADQESRRTGIPRERLLEYYRKAEGMRERVLSDKLMGFIKASAVITDRPESAGPEAEGR